MTLLAFSRMASGQNCSVWDTFGDGSLSPTWFGGFTLPTIISVGESGGQLQFWGNQNITGNTFKTYAWSSGWELDMTQSWAIQADWYANPPYANPNNVVSYAEVGLTFGVLLEGEALSTDIDRGITISASRGVSYANEAFDIQAIDYWTGGSDPVTQMWDWRPWSAATMYVWYDATLGYIYFDQYPPGVGASPMVAVNVPALSSESNRCILVKPCAMQSYS
jgi:hypothetical protein